MIFKKPFFNGSVENMQSFFRIDNLTGANICILNSKKFYFAIAEIMTQIFWIKYKFLRLRRYHSTQENISSAVKSNCVLLCFAFYFNFKIYVPYDESDQFHGGDMEALKELDEGGAILPHLRQDAP